MKYFCSCDKAQASLWLKSLCLIPKEIIGPKQAFNTFISTCNFNKYLVFWRLKWTFYHIEAKGTLFNMNINIYIYISFSWIS